MFCGDRLLSAPKDAAKVFHSHAIFAKNDQLKLRWEKIPSLA
jgi:hypothetical protein